jgi:hypothetical protein
MLTIFEKIGVFMKNLLFSLCAVFFLGCPKDEPCTTCPPPYNIPPGKREYVWSIDSIDYGSLPSTIQLESIWGSSATDVWGAAGDAPDVRDCLWHYDGTKWTRATEGTPITENTGNKTVYAVWGSAKNNVWAFGRKINQGVLSAFIMHYDGTKWIDATPVDVQAIAGHLYNVYGVSQNNIWVGGYEYALHYDGAEWRTYKVADSVIVGSISGNGGYIYIRTYSPWGKDGSFLYMLSGSAFSMIDFTTSVNPKFGGNLWAHDKELTTFTNGIISTSIGQDGTIDTSGWLRKLSTPTYFGEKIVQSSKNVFAVGQWNLIYHYNGTDWKQIFIEIPDHTVDSFALFWGVWTDGNEVFICDTENGIIYHGR